MVRYVGTVEIIVGGMMILPQETIEVGPNSLEMLRYQYGQGSFVDLSVTVPVVDAEPDPVVTVDAEPVEPLPVVEDVAPTSGKKKK